MFALWFWLNDSLHLFIRGSVLVGVTPKPANRFIAYNGAQPRWESRSIAKLTKMAVCAHKRFLHHIIDDGIITQYSACHGARAARAPTPKTRRRCDRHQVLV
jgi:hypothetical protein